VQVEISPEALSLKADDQLALLGVLALCGSGRHALVGDRDALLAWARRGAPGHDSDELVELIEVLLDDGEQREAIDRPRDRVALGPASRWTAPLCLRPLDALGLLCRPLSAWLENGINDFDFLLAFASPAERKELERARRDGWLQPVNAGGCGGIKLLISALRSEAPPPRAEQHRLFVLIDSDAEQPGCPSPTARAVETGLREHERSLGMEPGRLGAVLARREAENYIPPNALESWVQTTGNDKAKRTARSLRRQPLDERAHADIKAALGADLCRRFFRESPGLRDESNELHDILDRLLRRL
jgi:hypothetical protein